MKGVLGMPLMAGGRDCGLRPRDKSRSGDGGEDGGGKGPLGRVKDKHSYVSGAHSLIFSPLRAGDRSATRTVGPTSVQTEWDI